MKATYAGPRDHLHFAGIDFYRGVETDVPASVADAVSRFEGFIVVDEPSRKPGWPKGKPRKAA